MYATILKIANDRGHKTALRRDENVKLEMVLKTHSTLRVAFISGANFDPRRFDTPLFDYLIGKQEGKSIRISNKV